MQDNYHKTKQQSALAPQDISSNTTTNGANIDTTGWQAVLFLLMIGNYTDGDYDVTVQHADDDGNGSPDTWADVDDADLLPAGGAEAGAQLAAAGISKVGYRGEKKWVRIQVDSTNVSTGATAAAAAVLQSGRHLPFETQAIT